MNKEQPSYKNLRSILSERTNRLVLWLGAGLSIPADLPSWGQLKESLCLALIDKAAGTGPKQEEAALKKANQIRHIRDNWLAFQRLQQALGQTTFRAAIRTQFRNAETCKIPPNYLSLLELPVTGILNLNLDRLATRAYNHKYPGKSITEFSGFQAGQHLHTLQEASPFIVNLHGTISDESSWVLTQNQLQDLLKNEGYKEFIHNCFGSRTILFVGISANDVSVGGHLEALTKAKIKLGDHFWVTNRADADTDSWAEKYQLQIIRYRSLGDDHSGLSEMLSDLRLYEPQDEKVGPIKMDSVKSTGRLPSPDELREEHDPERIRELLNARAAILLSDSSKTDYEGYYRFCEMYDEAIYHAWYITNVPPRNKLFGYTIEKEIANGAFGRVFRAQDNEGRTFAIKILREEIRRRPDMLESFRRGVRSMRILAQEHVKGMIPYQEASEIPAVAVMEFVEGPNLQEAVNADYCSDWESILDIAVQIARIIRSAHLLPQRVFHRDLRPPNIMLKDYYRDPSELRVVILDFDLSWHLGSQEMSATFQSNSGFLAPEQVNPGYGMSTRSAAVDSYGVGMTLYYLRTGIEPQYLQHLHTNWEDDVYNTLSSKPCTVWQSIPIRYARLILNSTKHSQAERWDMGRIEGELQLLKKSLLFPDDVRSSELLAEELAQRVTKLGGHQRYNWDVDRLSAILFLPSGVELAIQADESAQCIKVQLKWSSTGTSHYKSIRKYLQPNMDQAISLLTGIGWRILQGSFIRRTEAGFTVSLTVEQLAGNIEVQTETINRVLKLFIF